MQLKLSQCPFLLLLLPYSSASCQTIQEPDESELSASDFFENQPSTAHFQGFLQANRDGLEQMVSFDWGLHFFRSKGLDRSDEYVEINGIPMNSFVDGTLPWREWSGLNDQFRTGSRQRPEQEQEMGRVSLAGHRQLSVSPFNNRLQQKAVISLANRFYRFRAAWTITQELKDKRHRLSGSIASRLGGFQGPFSSFSYLLSWGFKPTPETELVAVVLGVKSMRAKSSPLTAEVIRLLGPDYNPNGGEFEGKHLASRIEWFHHPMLILQYKSESSRHLLQLGAAFQEGRQLESRLAYRAAPHPNPIYYRYLPSYQANGSFGSSSNSIALEAGYLNHAQIDWSRLKSINASNPQKIAHYALLGDHQRKTRIAVASHFWFYGPKSNEGYLGLQYQGEKRGYFQRLLDVMGAQFWRDQDPFSQERFDTEGPLDKEQNERLGYHYLLNNQDFAFQGFWTFEGKRWRLQSGGHFHYLEGFRTGLFRNEQYATSSFGLSNKSIQRAWGGFVWGRLNFNLRQQMQIKAVVGNRPFVLERQFLEPQYSNRKVIGAATLPFYGLFLEIKRRQLLWDVRLSSFLLQFNEQRRPRTYYLESGLGEGLITEQLLRPKVVIQGIEGLLLTKLSTSSTLEIGLQFRKEVWGQNTDLIWYQRPTTNRGILPSQTEHFSQQANIRNSLRGNGPQSALGIRWNYRSPKRWWLQTGVHFLWNNRVSLAPSKYTPSFALNPDTQNYSGFSEVEIEFLRRPEQLPKAGYLHVTGGKSWRKGKYYTSLFLSLQNLTDLRVPTGGFQQGRVGHAELAANERSAGTPLFGNKYWTGQGRSFFLNLSMSY